MIRFLLVIFIFFLFLSALLGFSLIRGFRRMFFGNPPPHRNSSSGKRSKRTAETPPKRKTIFSKSDGEYVDYEEVK
ncbi:MAG: DUF4834 family protein [Tannerellaceae bacterium]|jgi:hypothetical protein|nr:DUF4834 family protein [Tannerellaceae bacterium]